MIASLTPCNIFVYAFQRWTCFTKPLVHTWQSNILLVVCHVENVACGCPFTEGLRGSDVSPCIRFAVRPTQNHRHWLEVGHETIWISPCVIPFGLDCNAGIRRRSLWLCLGLKTMRRLADHLQTDVRRHRHFGA